MRGDVVLETQGTGVLLEEEWDQYGSRKGKVPGHIFLTNISVI